MKNVYLIIVLILSGIFSYLGYRWMQEEASGAVLGFILIAAPGFYYVLQVLPKERERKAELERKAAEEAEAENTGTH